MDTSVKEVNVLVTGFGVCAIFVKLERQNLTKTISALPSKMPTAKSFLEYCKELTPSLGLHASTPNSDQDIRSSRTNLPCIIQ